MIERLEQLEQRSNKAFERFDAPGATDALWNARAARAWRGARGRLRRRILWRRASRGGYGAVERTVVPGGVVADVDAAAARVDAYDMEAVDRGITGWQESVRVVVEAHVERGTGVLGPAAARAAAACCPEDCRRRRRAPRPRAPTSRGGHGLCLPATGQCACFPNGGYTGAACGECAAGFARSRGLCVKQRRRAAPAPPAAAPANATAAGGDASLDAADPSAAALRALVGVAAAVLCLCAFGTTCGGCGRLVSRVLRAKEDAREDAEDELGGDEELGKGLFTRAPTAFRISGIMISRGTSPRRKARDAFPPAPVFEFRRARAVQGGFIEEALGTAQGKWRAYVVDPNGARRAGATEISSPAPRRRRRRRIPTTARADSFAGEDANGFFFPKR